MKWLENIKNVSSGREPGKCPICGSDNTDYALHIVNEKTSMGFGVIWCKDCKRGFNMSRMKINKNDVHIKEIPDGIDCSY